MVQIFSLSKHISKNVQKTLLGNTIKMYAQSKKINISVSYVCFDYFQAQVNLQNLQRT